VTEDAGVTLLPEAVIPLSSELLELLEVRNDVGITEHQIGLERVIADRDARDSDTIDREIRSYLHSFAGQIEEASAEEIEEAVTQLGDCPFIYIPDASPEFRTMGQVAWSTGLGNHIEAINTYYRGFHDLFVEVFGVPPEPTFETYLEFFQHADEDRWGPVEEAWREIPRRIIQDESLEWELDEITTRLRETDAIPTADGRIVPYDEIEYVADREGVAERLPESIASSVALPSYDQRFDRDDVVSILSDILGATPLDTALERSVVHPAYESTSGDLYSSFGRCLDVGNSVLTERDSVTETVLRQLADIARYSLQDSSRLQCEYLLEGERQVAAHDEAVYIDTEEEHIIIRETDAVWLDLVDEIAATLGLTGGDRTNFTALVKGAVGKSPDLIDAYLRGEDISHMPLFTDTVGTQAEESGNKEGSSPRNDSTITGTSSTTTTPNGKDTIGSSDTDSERQSSGADRSMAPSQDDSSSLSTDDPWQSTEDWASPNEVSDTDTGASTPTPPVSEQSAGGGVSPNEAGRKGEEFAMDYLQTLIAEAVGSGATVNNLQNGYRIQAVSRGEERTVDIQYVPDRSDPHCDILVTGAALSRDEDQLVVTDIAEEEQALVEVKSTESHSRKFILSGQEHQNAQAHPDSYYITRVVQVGSEDEHLHTVFDSVPEFRVDIETDDRLSLQNLGYDLTLSY